jgi:hypothetical protein
MPSFQDTYNQRVQQEIQRRQSSGQYGNNASNLSPEWLNSLNNEIQQGQAQDQISQLTDPNSQYYQSVNKSIRGNLTGAMSPDSLLALTVAMGGSPAQAQQQIKAQQGKITDSAGQLTNNLYLGAQNTAANLTGEVFNNQQSNANRYFQQDQYNQQKHDSLMNSILNGVLGIGGNILGSFIGDPLLGSQITGASSLFGGGDNKGINNNGTSINSFATGNFGLNGYKNNPSGGF